MCVLLSPVEEMRNTTKAEKTVEKKIYRSNKTKTAVIAGTTGGVVGLIIIIIIAIW